MLSVWSKRMCKLIIMAWGISLCECENVCRVSCPWRLCDKYLWIGEAVNQRVVPVSPLTDWQHPLVPRIPQAHHPCHEEAKEDLLPAIGQGIAEAAVVYILCVTSKIGSCT